MSEVAARLSGLLRKRRSTSTPRSSGVGTFGMGVSYRLMQQCPEQHSVALEAQAGFGNARRTHPYPGIRSDGGLCAFGCR